MPVDPELPQTEWATLGQAVRWVAFGLVPRPDAFESLEYYPKFIGEDFESALGEFRDGKIRDRSAEDQQRIDAKYSISKHLMLGRLHAEGCKGISALGSHGVMPSNWIVNEDDELETISPHHYLCREHEAEHTSIPSEFWHPGRILWESGIVYEPPCEWSEDGSPSVKDFRDVRILTTDLQRLFPLPNDIHVSAADARGSQGKRGPKPIYDREEFFILCALAAAHPGLPDKQADFVVQMSELLTHVWGEGHTPETSWLQARFNDIKKVREASERGRKAAEVPKNRNRR